MEINLSHIGLIGSSSFQVKIPGQMSPDARVTKLACGQLVALKALLGKDIGEVQVTFSASGEIDSIDAGKNPDKKNALKKLNALGGRMDFDTAKFSSDDLNGIIAAAPKPARVPVF